jgi:hypothetical protein
MALLKVTEVFYWSTSTWLLALFVRNQSNRLTTNAGSHNVCNVLTITFLFKDRIMYEPD